MKMKKTDRKLPPDEIAICRRLVEIRKIFDFSLEELAKKVGLTRNRLACYEYARAPLRADIALKICRELNINEEWLMEGFGIFQPSIFSELGDIENKIKPNMLFSDAFNFILVNEYTKKNKRIPSTMDNPVRCLTLPESDRLDEAKKIIRFLAESWISQIPPEHLQEFINLLWNMTIDFESKWNIGYKFINKNQIVSMRKRLEDAGGKEHGTKE